MNRKDEWIAETNDDMNRISIKQKLGSTPRLNGCWIETFSPIAAEIMASSGYDTAMIDLEHGPGSYLDALSMMQAVANHGCAPMIRAESADPVVIKRILDIGPMALMVPNVRTAGEARDVVEACRYGPTGHRGAAPAIIRGTGYGKDVDGYLQWLREEFLLIGQIESAQAVEQVDDIANVEGMDMLFVGPSDLSASLGDLDNYERDEFIDAFDRIRQGALAAGKWLGTIAFRGWDAERLYREGHNLVLSGADTLLLRQAAEKDVENLRRAASA